MNNLNIINTKKTKEGIDINMINKIPKTIEESNEAITNRILKESMEIGKMVIRKNLSTAGLFLRLVNNFTNDEIIEIISTCEKNHQYNPKNGGFVIFKSWVEDSWTIIADGDRYANLVNPLEEWEIAEYTTRRIIESNKSLDNDLSLTSDEIDLIMINIGKVLRGVDINAFESALYKLTIAFVNSQTNK